MAGSTVAGGAIALVVFSIAPSIWLTMLLAFGALLFLSIGWPVFITFATDVAGPSRATGIGMMGASNRMGGFAGSGMGGAFLAIGGFAAVGQLCLLAVAVSVLIMRFAMREPDMTPWSNTNDAR